MKNEEHINENQGTNSLIILMGILGGKIDDLSRVLSSIDKHLNAIEKCLTSAFDSVKNDNNI